MAPLQVICIARKCPFVPSPRGEGRGGVASNSMSVSEYLFQCAAMFLFSKVCRCPYCGSYKKYHSLREFLLKGEAPLFSSNFISKTAPPCHAFFFPSPSIRPELLNHLARQLIRRALKLAPDVLKLGGDIDSLRAVLLALAAGDTV